MKEEEDALRKRFTEQVRTEESKFRKWEQEVRIIDCYIIIFIIKICKLFIYLLLFFSMIVN